ncbi:MULTISPECIES: ribosome hibernation-promoting factor, HPF/YfiA family [unclassified Sphingomonas]|jgi:ribosomal subunit interface protein|uniref:ribosome hibernation-promoting factor, HPF/YfiA family n=1 Tax=unclassified Sphingomonas TaxID=196159 RepID=UPI00083253B0|nr:MULTISPECIES: ribosome-associated translation inhibitor RaiA [unclassified Sphingomonas]MCH4893601.1 ribosome-associated translation inhibitor RaiA [Sphingomonas sp. SFZ2018-12]
MEIRVSGHQVDTGAALKQHVSERLQSIADKYFSRAISAHVTFGKGPHDNGFTCDIVAHVMQGLILKGSNMAMDSAQLAFDGAADKIEKQLRRYMRRLKDRNSAQAVGVDQLNGYDDAGYTVFNPPAADDEAEVVADAPLIVAETRVDVPDASVSDAVMMLDLRNTNALLFKNSGTGAFNMVYRRGDGTIGWVEPNRAQGPTG